MAESSVTIRPTSSGPSSRRASLATFNTSASPRSGWGLVVAVLGAAFGPPALVVLVAAFGPPALVVLGATFGPPALVVLVAAFGPPASDAMAGGYSTMRRGHVACWCTRSEQPTRSRICYSAWPSARL